MIMVYGMRVHVLGPSQRFLRRNEHRIILSFTAAVTSVVGRLLLFCWFALNRRFGKSYMNWRMRMREWERGRMGWRTGTREQERGCMTGWGMNCWRDSGKRKRHGKWRMGTRL